MYIQEYILNQVNIYDLIRCLPFMSQYLSTLDYSQSRNEKEKGTAPRHSAQRHST